MTLLRPHSVQLPRFSRFFSAVPRAALIPLALWTLAACGGPSDVGPLRHVLLISMDTTRADHLGCYGGRVRTPNIDALAAEGVRFADVTSPAPTTLAAHTSLMTGCWPHTHGVVRNGFVVNGENVMLAEILRDAGFHTAAVLGSFALERRFDFNQGFAHYDEQFDLLVTPFGFDQNQRSAEKVTAALLAHLDEVGDGPERLFLFAHYFDPHAPYAPPAPHDAAYRADGSPATSDGRDIERAVRAHQRAITGQEFGHGRVIIDGLVGDARKLVGRSGEPGEVDRRMADLYAGEIAYVDAAIGDLLAGLRERGLLEQTLVVLVADHGETFWEHHDFWNHGLWVHQTTVQVPLLLRFPDGRHRSRVVEQPVSTIDLLPTLCELLDLELPERCEGVSLVPLMKGLALRRGPVYSVATQPGRVVERPGEWGNRYKPHCVRDGPWKYVRSPYQGGIEQLFHLGDDPREREDLLRGTPTPGLRARLETLRATLDRWSAGASPLPSHFDRSQIEDTRRRLKALGYGGGPESGDGSRDGSGDDDGREPR